MFYTQLSDLLRAGVPLLRSLELLERQTRHGTLKIVLQEVRDQVADGTRLAEAMRQHPTVFSDLTVSMIRAGEEGSFMEDTLQRIAEFTEHQEELKGRVIGAMAYPAFLVVIGSLILVGMLVFFVPKFEPLFDRMREGWQCFLVGRRPPCWRSAALCDEKRYGCGHCPEWRSPLPLTFLQKYFAPRKSAADAVRRIPI